MTLPSRLTQRIFPALLAAIALAASPSWADITSTGDVSNSNGLTVGMNGTGTLLVTNGGFLTSQSLYIGYNAGSIGTITIGDSTSIIYASMLIVGRQGNGTLNIINGAVLNFTHICDIGEQLGGAGTVTVDGTGSAWPDIEHLNVGGSGSGTLNITNGGIVSAFSTFVATATGSGSINFGAHGGTLTTTSLYAAPAQFSGTGTIKTNGLVSDCNLVFDATHGRNQSLNWSNASQSVNLNLSVAGTSSTSSVSDLGVGYLGTGTLAIRDGMAIRSANGYLGFNPGATGTATVDGPGSLWSSDQLYVGYRGTGTLNITNGGKVYGSGINIGSMPGSAGRVTVDGSVLSSSLFVGPAGTLTVTNGGKVTSASATIAPMGTATIDGANSTWTLSGSLSVGNSGTGTLNITHGGKVSDRFGYIGGGYGATGTVTVDDSTWTNDSWLYIGSNSTCKLNITNGGQVTTGGVTIYAKSLLSLNVGDGSFFNSGTSVSNDGTLRLKAVPGLAAGTYTPIIAGNWSGTGTTRALGGIWNTASHTFTVSPAATGTAALPVTIDPSQTQRLTITDPTTTQTLHANFLATTVSSSLTFTATLLTDAQSSFLDASIPSNAQCLSAWTFSTDGYNPGDPVFLSLQIGPNLSPSTLSLYQFDGATWSPYSAPDLSYDGTYANFTITSFSGYAVTTTPVPEPTTLLLLTLATATLLLPRRRRHP